jgi:hypothetical protein
MTQNGLMRAKQAFLYSIFELLQRNLPIFLVGITTHEDLNELLEKRIRSRFSNNHVRFLPYKPHEIIAILTIQYNAIYGKRWNSVIQSLKSDISSLCELGYSLPWFINTCDRVVDFGSPKDSIKYLVTVLKDSFSERIICHVQLSLQDCTILEWAVLGAMLRLHMYKRMQSVTLAMAMEDFDRGRQFHSAKYDKHDFHRAFSSLLSKQLVHFVDEKAARSVRMHWMVEFEPVQFSIDGEYVLDMIQNNRVDVLPTKFQAWILRNVV